MELDFFPIDLAYETNIVGRAAIQLFGRTINNEKICVIDPNFEPYFYAIPENHELITRLIGQISLLSYEEDNSRFFVTKIEQVKKKVLRKEIDALKIYVNHPSAVPQLKREVKLINGIKEIREADLLFIRRYLIDKNLVPSLLTKVEGDLIERSDLNVDLVIRAKDIKQVISTESNEKLKLLAFDIEVYTLENQYPSDNKDPILMISLVGDNFQKVITWKEFKTDKDYIEFVKNESELILKFKEILLDYNPDYLIGYFSDGFDLPYIKARAKINKIPLIFNNHNLQISTKGRETIAKILGISHLDIFKFIKNIMAGSLRLDNYTLNNVSLELLKEKKIDLRPDLIGVAWDLGNEEIEKYCEYNLQDSILVLKLADKIIPNIEELVRLTSTPAFDVCRMGYSQLVENYLIKCSKDYNELYPNKPDRGTLSLRKTQTYQGAFVFNPNPGLYENIAVFDFLSLYPSIIVSHNICLSTLLNEFEENSFETPEILENNSKVKFYFTSKYDGFIPTVLKDVLLKRSKIKALLKQNKDPILESRSYALKTVANATYGYFAFFGARWYSKECAMSITSLGRKYIQEVIEKAQSKNIKILYADTDSIFISLEDKSKDFIKEFIKQINIELPSFMELELENFYSRAIFVMKKGENEEGAKKKYALISEDGKIKVRGFETIRRDWSYIAKETQKKVLELILKNKDIEGAFNYVKNVIEDIKNKKISNDLMIIRTQLKKEVGNYDLIGPHVVIAKKMQDKGLLVPPGSVIRYIVEDGKGLIRDKAVLPEESKSYDSKYYIENQVLPAVDKIFESVGYDKSELIEEKSQLKLKEFLK
ncbi:hypothetical protein J4455_02595 [Candidatus Woesearchaeota archaeon]|nr:hypothetical protein [Candidatus Woesearchaeota archaeon]